jgi:iron complex outermembrane receptor protein
MTLRAGVVLFFPFLLGVSTPSGAQTSQAPAPPVRFELPTVIVAVEKRPQDVLDVPVSVTTVQRETLQSAGMRYVSDAARRAPNAFMHEFTARKLSNPRFRGIGSGPNNPGVTTYIDGVPQLSANSSSLELIDVNQIEFARGPQSALFGRNTVGGLINIASRAPSRTAWTGEVAAPFGNRALRDVRGSVSGPVVSDRVAVGFAAGYSARDGYTVNDVTGNTLDDRSATFGKVQLLFTPAASWDARVIVSAERARDGDYALQDLAALRQQPFHASRNFEGFTHRDVVAPTVLLTHRGRSIDVSSTTGIVRWKTRDQTDLDYGPLPLIVRDNSERDVQFTQELRVASAAASPLVLSSTLALRWQAGVSLFTQNYEQDAVNSFSPFLLSPLIPFPVTQHSPLSTLDDVGVGAYGQGTWTLGDRVDLSAGARFDHEKKEGNLSTFFSPAIAPPGHVAAEADFTHVSPQFSATFRATPRVRVYGTVAEGFKAGGFNAASPAGREAYGEEESWNYEAGVKTSLLNQRLALSLAVFRIDWRDMQLNVPNPAVPAQFFISNTGEARSSGVEVELAARPSAGVDLFASLGSTAASFGSGTTSSGIPVGGNRLPDTPRYTANAGAQVSRPVAAGASLFVRGDVTVYGDRFFDEFNAASQDPYALTNLQVGVRGARLFAEGWVRNALAARYVTLALAYAGLAPSGYIGEPGAPRTFGVRVGMNF